MSTDMYGYEEANPYGYGEATPGDASKLGYELTSDNKYGNESPDNINTHGSDNDPYGYGDSNPYGYGDDSQVEAPRARERPRRRGSVTKFSLDEDVQEAKASFEESSPQNQEANDAPALLISSKSTRKLKLKNPLSRKK
jgi:hypothetical protein